MQASERQHLMITHDLYVMPSVYSVQNYVQKSYYEALLVRYLCLMCLRKGSYMKENAQGIVGRVTPKQTNIR